MRIISIQNGCHHILRHQNFCTLYLNKWIQLYYYFNHRPIYMHIVHIFGSVSLKISVSHMHFRFNSKWNNKLLKIALAREKNRFVCYFVFMRCAREQRCHSVCSSCIFNILHTHFGLPFAMKVFFQVLIKFPQPFDSNGRNSLSERRNYLPAIVRVCRAFTDLNMANFGSDTSFTFVWSPIFF